MSALKAAIDYLIAHDEFQLAGDLQAEAQTMAQLVKVGRIALKEYANEDNWGQSPNEDWDRWLASKNGYRLAEVALGQKPLVDDRGFEPPTSGLDAPRSAVEL